MNENMLDVMREYAKQHRIPILRNAAWACIVREVPLMEFQTILEIGSAIGYSALLWHKATKAHIIGLEKNEALVRIAHYFIQQAHCEHVIRIHCEDARTWQYESNQFFDCLFIDAAKTQNQTFFKRYWSYVRLGGYIITDNMHIGGLIHREPETLPKRLRRLVATTQSYHLFLKHLSSSDTVFYDEGDGIAITQKRAITL